MKKKLKAVLMSLLLVVCMPFALVLTGCGATPSNEIKGIKFVSPTYDDETGFAVFEVDVNVATFLTYKLNPSSGAGYAITYAIKECPAQNLSRFTLRDGIINVGSTEFEDIKIDIFANGKSDTCIVRLKKYPNSVFVYDVDGVSETRNLEVSVNALGTYSISPYGRFLDPNGRSYIKPILEYDYTFRVETSDPTIIDVPKSNRLKINAVTPKPLSATVTVSLLNTAGQVLHTFEIKVNVVLNAAKASAILDGCGTFVNSDDDISITISTDPSKSDLTVDADGNYVLGYKVFAYSSDDRYIKGVNVSTIARVSETRYIEYSKTSDALIIDKTSPSFTFNMKIWTNLIDDEGLPFVLSFNVSIVVE